MNVLHWLENSLDESIASSVLDLLKFCRSLEVLDLRSNYLNHNFIINSIVPGLTLNHSLKNLDLSENSISDDTAKELLREITNNVSITNISLQQNHPGVSVDTRRMLREEIVSRNQRLEKLFVQEIFVGQVRRMILQGKSMWDINCVKLILQFANLSSTVLESVQNGYLKLQQVSQL